MSLNILSSLLAAVNKYFEIQNKNFEFQRMKAILIVLSVRGKNSVERENQM